MAFLAVNAGKAAADAVTDWNNVVVTVTIGASPSRPNPETAIAAAYMHIAIYDANRFDRRPVHAVCDARP